MFRLALVSFALVAACGNDPMNESGDPDPEPRSADEMTALGADLKERAKALNEKGLCSLEAIGNAPSPDERYKHCRGEPWDGNERIKTLLSDPSEREKFCSQPIINKVAFSFYPLVCEKEGES